MKHHQQAAGSHGLHPIKLNLSHHQIRKAHAGHQIQVHHSDIGVGHVVHVHPETHKKLLKAHASRKGARVHITHHELAGSGFMDVLKKVASPVLSGIAGVAGELFPSHKDTINKVREGIRGATGYGVRPKQMHQGRPMKSSNKGFIHGGAVRFRGPEHAVGYDSDHYGFGITEGYGSGITEGYGTGVANRKRRSKKGSGIMPAGYGY